MIVSPLKNAHSSAILARDVYLGVLLFALSNHMHNEGSTFLIKHMLE